MDKKKDFVRKFESDFRMCISLICTGSFHRIYWDFYISNGKNRFSWFLDIYKVEIPFFYHTRHAQINCQRDLWHFFLLLLLLTIRYMK